MLPALAGISSVFGGGGPSEAAQLTEMVLEAIQELSHQIQINHGEVLGRFTDLQDIALENQRYLAALTEGSVRSCASLFPSDWFVINKEGFRSEALLDIDHSLWFDNYDDMRTRFGGRARNLESCLRADSKGLRHHFGSFTSFEVFEQVTVDGTTRDGLTLAPQSNFETSDVSLRAYKSRLGKLRASLDPSALVWFATPGLTTKTLRDKVGYVAKGFPPSVESLAQLSNFPLVPFVKNNHHRLLNPNKLLVLSRFALALHPMYDMLDSENKLIPLDDLLVPKIEPAHEGLDNLRKANQILSLGISNQSWAQGDLWLPIFYFLESFPENINALTQDEMNQLLDRQSKLEAALLGNKYRAESLKKEKLGKQRQVMNEYRALIKEHIDASVLLQHNYALYALKRESTERSKHGSAASPRLFELAYAGDRVEAFHSLFSSRWKFEKDYKIKRGDKEIVYEDWSMEVYGHRVAVPEPNQFRAGEFIPTRSMIELLRTRARVVDEIAGYELIEAADLGEIDARLLKAMYLSGRSSSLAPTVNDEG